MYRRHCAPAVQSGQVSVLAVQRGIADEVKAHLAGGVQAASAVHALHAQEQSVERYVIRLLTVWH